MERIKSIIIVIFIVYKMQIADKSKEIFHLESVIK